MSDESIELQGYEIAPYQRAIQAGYLALRKLEQSMGGAPALPQDAAEVAIGAAVRRLVADGQLPALGTRRAPARVYAPGSQAHRYAPPVAPVLDRPRAAFTTTTAADVESVKRVADQQARIRERATPAEDDHRIEGEGIGHALAAIGLDGQTRCMVCLEENPGGDCCPSATPPGHTYPTFSDDDRTR